MGAGDIISLIGLGIVLSGMLISAGVLVGQLKNLADSINRLSGTIEKLDTKVDDHSERLAKLEVLQALLEAPLNHSPPGI